MKEAEGKFDPNDLPENVRRTAEQLGIDLGLLAENLRLTPLERLRRHDRSIRQILALRERFETDLPPETPHH